MPEVAAPNPTLRKRSARPSRPSHSKLRNPKAFQFSVYESSETQFPPVNPPAPIPRQTATKATQKFLETSARRDSSDSLPVYMREADPAYTFSGLTSPELLPYASQEEPPSFAEKLGLDTCEWILTQKPKQR